MNKAQLLACGVPENVIPALQDIWHEEMARRIRRQPTQAETGELRAAIMQTVRLVKQPDSLRAILAGIVKAVSDEASAKPEEAKATQAAEQPGAEERGRQE